MLLIMEKCVKRSLIVPNVKKGIVLKKYSNMTKLAGLLIASFPILSPYQFLGISVNWILGGIYVICHLLIYAVFPITKSTKPLMLYTAISMFLSLNGLLILRDPSNLINAEIAMAIDLIVYVLLWYYSDINVTMKYADIFGYICCGFAVVQMLATISGGNVPLGQLPFLEISSGWVSEVWGFRFNSLFSEPSYFAIYLLPLFVYHFLKNDWLKTVLFASFIVLSSSSLGIISMVMVLLFRFFSSSFSVKNKFAFLMIVVAAFVFANILMNNVPIIKTFTSRTFNKIDEIFSSSSNGGFMDDVRLGGYLNLFDELPLKEQIFGVGNAQLQNYFAEHGVSVYNYSNSFILSLLNFGLLGFIIFLTFLGSLFDVSRREKTFLFWIVLVLALGVDSLLFSYRYYWLVYFVLFTNKRMEKRL